MATFILCIQIIDLYEGRMAMVWAPRSPVINPVIVDTGRVIKCRVREAHQWPQHIATWSVSRVPSPPSIAILPVIDLFVHWPLTAGAGDWTVSNIEQETVGAGVLLPGHYNCPRIVSVLSISCLVLFSFWVLSGLWRLPSRVVKESL